MASSRMIVTKKKNVFVSHICSGCGFPVISVVRFEAESQKTYTFSQGKAEKIAEETAEEAINTKIREIGDCHVFKRILTEQQTGNGMISPGYFCKLSHRGLGVCCPLCLNCEPWQSVNSPKAMEELAKDNFPIVFTKAQEAENWANDKVTSMIQELNHRHEDEESMNNAIEKVIDLKVKIKIYDDEIKAISEIDECEKAKSELSEIEKIKSKLGALDIKGKKASNEKIKKLKLQIQELNKIIEKKGNPVARKIIDLRNELLKVQSIAFGCSEEIDSKREFETFSYFISPNDIPDDIIGKIDESYEQQKKAILEPVTEQSQDLGIVIDKPVFCRKCGYKLLPDSEFCSKCGTKVM